MSEPLSSLQRLELIQLVNRLSSAEFRNLEFALDPPPGLVPPITAAQSDRVNALLGWVGSPSGCGLEEFIELLRRIIPEKLKEVIPPELPASLPPLELPILAEFDGSLIDNASLPPLNLPIPADFNDSLIEKVRDHCKKEIKRQFSKVQIISHGQVDISQIYVDTRLLEKPESQFYRSPRAVLDPDKNIPNEDGFEAAEKYNKLIILGKPGSGKTTFARNIVNRWYKGEYKSNSIAIVIEFREYSGEKISLEQEIDKRLGLEDYSKLDAANLAKSERKSLNLKKYHIAFKKRLQDSKSKIAKLKSEIDENKTKLENIDKINQEIEQKINKLKLEIGQNREEYREADEINNYEKERSRLHDAKHKNMDERTACMQKENELKKDLRKAELDKSENYNSYLNVSYRTSEIKEIELYINSLPLFTFLNMGKLLIVIDGFDEIVTENSRNILKEQIIDISNKYPENTIIMTSRTQAIDLDSSLRNFKVMEIKGFDKTQTNDFVRNWFRVNSKPQIKLEEYCEKFDNSIKKNSYLRELAKTPVLLNLICLILTDSQEIPSEKIWLYRKGIEVLLKDWNEERDIEEPEIGPKVYQNLDLHQKENLLSEIAYHKFGNSDNYILFKEIEIANQISNHLNLENQKEGILIIKSIEAEHGLLIERAHKLWSFSHLTFQEYFTYQRLLELPCEELYQKTINQKWQDIIKRLIISQQPADDLLNRIIEAIQNSVSSNSTMTKVLDWIHEKSNSVTGYREEAVQAFYYNLFSLFAIDSAKSRARIREFVKKNSPYKLELSSPDYMDSHRPMISVLDELYFEFLKSDLIIDLDSKIYAKESMPFILEYALYYCLELSIACKFVVYPDRSLVEYDDYLDQHLSTFIYYILDLALSRAFELSINDTFVQEIIDKLRKDLSILKRHPKSSEDLVEGLHKIMANYLGAEKVWPLSNEEKKQVRECYTDFYHANRFLIDLLRTEGAVSEDNLKAIRYRLFTNRK